MAKYCGLFCDAFDNVTKDEWDRYTDQIEKLLDDNKGIHIFGKYLSKREEEYNYTIRKLNFWKLTNSMILNGEKNEVIRDFLKDFGYFLKEAKDIKVLDEKIIEDLTNVNEKSDIKKIVDTLKIVKKCVTDAMSQEYHVFKINILVKLGLIKYVGLDKKD